MGKLAYIRPADAAPTYADPDLPDKYKYLVGMFDAVGRDRIRLYSVPILLSGAMKYYFQGVAPGSYYIGDHYYAGTIRLFRTEERYWKNFAKRDEAAAREGLFVAADEEAFLFHDSARARFKKPFQLDGRGGDSVEIAAPSMTLWSIDAITVGAFPFIDAQDFRNGIYTWVSPDEYFPEWDYTVNAPGNFQKLYAEVSGRAVALELEEEEISAGATIVDAGGVTQTLASRAVKVYAAEPVYMEHWLLSTVSHTIDGTPYKVCAAIERRPGWERLHLATKVF